MLQEHHQNVQLAAEFDRATDIFNTAKGLCLCTEMSEALLKYLLICGSLFHPCVRFFFHSVHSQRDEITCDTFTLDLLNYS